MSEQKQKLEKMDEIPEKSFQLSLTQVNEIKLLAEKTKRLVEIES